MLTFLCLVCAVFLIAEALFSRLRAPASRRGLAIGGALFALATLGLLWLSSESEKVIGQLIMPAGLLWLAGLATISLHAARRDWSAASTVAALWLVYSLIGSVPLGALMVHSLERPYGGTDPFASTYDAVIVLGGGTASRGEYDYLGLSGDRVALGARLWHTGRTGTLVTTGSTSGSARHTHQSAEVTSGIWMQLGVSEESIIRVPQPTNTRQELEAIATLIQQHGWTHVGVVSSARHLPRVMRNAQRWEANIVPLPADFRGASQAGGLAWFVPSGAGFMLVHTATWEWVGSLTGR